MCFKHPIVISKRALLALFHIPTDPSWVPEWHAYVARRIYFSEKFIFGADFKTATREAQLRPQIRRAAHGLGHIGRPCHVHRSCTVAHRPTRHRTGHTEPAPDRLD